MNRASLMIAASMVGGIDWVGAHAPSRFVFPLRRVARCSTYTSGAERAAFQKFAQRVKPKRPHASRASKARRRIGT